MRILPVAFLALSVAAAGAMPAMAQQQKQHQSQRSGGTMTQADIARSVEASSIIGKSAKGPNGQDIGDINDLLINQQGQVQAAVVDVGGFLGMGQRQVAVDWKSVRMDPANDQVTVNMTREQLSAAPEITKPDMSDQRNQQRQQQGQTPRSNDDR